MALTDISVPEKTITDTANSIREKLTQIVSLAEIRLLEIRNLVREHTRVAIAAEFGSDAADLLTVYNKLKEAIEITKNITIDDLP